MDTTTEEEIITPEEETLEIDIEDEGTYVPPTKEEVEALKKKLKTVEAQKEHFRKKATQTKTIAPSDTFTRDEAVLIATGMDIDDLDKLKAIQKGLGLKDLKEAKESDLFTAYSEKKKKEQEREKASLGASNGSGTSADTGFHPGMSAEEHRKAWEESRK